MPPTIAYPLIAFACLLLLALVGIGPSLYLISRANARRVQLALLISPAVALAEIGLIFYPLFVNSTPLNQFHVPMVFLLVGVSVFLMALDWRRRQGDYRRLVSKRALLYIVVYIFAFVLLMLPAYLGGNLYRYWQANAYDATNYWGMTYFIERLPLSFTLDPQASISGLYQNPILLFPINGGLAPRPVVELPFAWFTQLFNVPVYEFYYYFKLLALAVAFPTALSLSLILNLRNIFYRLLFAAILSAGFWAWFISDVDALSNLYVLPLSILFLLSWLQLEQDAPLQFFTRQRLFFSLGFAALLGYYPEMTPLTLAALALYYARLWLVVPARENLRRTVGLLVSAALLIALVLPTLPPMVRDILGQARFATFDVSDGWASVYFPWLYTRDMLAGRLWGLALYTSESTLNVLFVGGLGAALGILALVGLVKSLFDEKSPPHLTIVASLALAFWGAAFALTLLDRGWIAGKAFGMGAPFALTALFVYGHHFMRSPSNWRVPRLLAAALIAVWGISQVLVTPIRAVVFANQQDFSGYVGVRSVTGSIVPVMNYLREHSPELLVSAFPRSYDAVEVGWAMMLSHEFHHRSLGGFSWYYALAPMTYWQEFDEVPSHLLFNSADNYLSASGQGTLIPLEDTPFRLYAVTPDDLNQAISATSFLLPDEQTGFNSAFLPLVSGTAPMRLLSTEQGRIRFLGGSPTTVGLLLRYEADADGSLTLTLNNTHLTQTDVQAGQASHFSLCTTMKVGTNDLLVDYQTTGDYATTPLKITEFRVAASDFEYLDIGSAMDALSSEDGWYGREVVDEHFNFRWSAQTARLAFQICEPSDYTLRFRAFPFEAESPQQVPISVNGTALEPVTLLSGLQEYAVAIPASLLTEDGLQTVEFAHSRAEIPPNDSRELAAFYDWVTIQRVSS